MEQSVARMPSIPVPEPDLTPAQIIARAEAMRDMLRAQADESDNRGHYSPAVHEAFQRAGFYRMLQPRLFGGYEFDFATFYRVIIEISRGDPSTGWCLALASGHAFTLASHWSADAQAEIFGAHGEFRAPSRAAAKGQVTRADGGYRVNGTWDFCSGIPYSTHVLNTSRLVQPGEPDAIVAVIVPRKDYEILDDWGDILGLRGSGSNSCQVDNALVPENYVVPCDWFEMNARPTPGTELHKNPMYLGMTGAFYHGETVSATVGAAKAALDEFERMVKSRKTAKPPIVPRYQNQDYQQTFGLALTLVDCAEGLLMRVAEMHMQACRRWWEIDEPFTAEMAMRMRGMLQTAGRFASEATEMLFFSTGPSAAKNSSPMQRYFRDVMTYNTHVQSQQRTTAHELARARWGIRNAALVDAT